MAKQPKSVYICNACGAVTSRWAGQCPDCGEWNTLEEGAAPQQAELKTAKRHKITNATRALRLDEVPEEEQEREKTGIGELDRVLGGGLVGGSLVLLGGDPGIGKSTLLLQVCANLAARGQRVLYISGEESARQIRMRARRLHIDSGDVYLLCETNMAHMEAQLDEIQPDCIVVDSIQTMYKPELSSAPGGVSQIRECASVFMRECKTRNMAAFLVGHVTKEGSLAGPRVLEHIVDAVLYFEGEKQHEFRLLRAAKNRFGSVNEIGVFEMTQEGMREVENPSAILLGGRARDAAGCAVIPAILGSRCMLVDMQALAAPTSFPSPRRSSSGIDVSRLALLIAVLEKRANVALYNQDVYVNVAGGMALTERAADLPILLTIASSRNNQMLHPDYAIFGEVGLAGEVRAVSQPQRRIDECVRMGFKGVVLPAAGGKGLVAPEGFHIVMVRDIRQAMGHCLGKG